MTKQDDSEHNQNIKKTGANFSLLFYLLTKYMFDHGLDADQDQDDAACQRGFVFQ